MTNCSQAQLSRRKKIDTISNAFGRDTLIEIDGVEYHVKPAGLELLRKAESKILSQGISYEDEVAGISRIAEANPEFAAKLWDRMLERRRGVPIEEVMLWLLDEAEGKVFLAVEAFRLSNPGLIEDGKVSPSDIVKAFTESKKRELAVNSDLGGAANPSEAQAK